MLLCQMRSAAELQRPVAGIVRRPGVDLEPNNCVSYIAAFCYGMYTELFFWHNTSSLLISCMTSYHKLVVNLSLVILYLTDTVKCKLRNLNGYTHKGSLLLAAEQHSASFLTIQIMEAPWVVAVRWKNVLDAKHTILYCF